MTQRGELERAVMQALWAADGSLTARDVAEHLADRELAMTTVLTVLGRLESKGLLTRSRAGRAHSYAPVADRAGHTAELMRQALDSGGDRQDALVRFVDAVSDDDLAALRRALDER